MPTRAEILATFHDTADAHLDNSRAFFSEAIRLAGLGDYDYAIIANATGARGLYDYLILQRTMLDALLLTVEDEIFYEWLLSANKEVDKVLEDYGA